MWKTKDSCLSCVSKEIQEKRLYEDSFKGNSLRREICRSTGKECTLSTFLIKEQLVKPDFFCAILVERIDSDNFNSDI